MFLAAAGGLNDLVFSEETRSRTATSSVALLEALPAQHGADRAPILALAPAACPCTSTRALKVRDPNATQSAFNWNTLLRAGCGRTGADNDFRYLAGDLDEIHIWSVERSEAKIRDHHLQTIAPAATGLVEPLATDRNRHGRRGPGRYRRRNVANHPYHVWHVDLTTFPFGGGFRLPWLPFALPPVWPFAFWVAVVLDRYSRGVVAFKVYLRPPRAQQITELLSNAEQRAGCSPKSIVTDRGVQFQELYREWCKARGVRARYGALQRSNSLAVIERFIRSIKTECLRKLVVPSGRASVEHELSVYFRWYHLHRPHQGLGGLVPADRWHGVEAHQGDSPSAARGRRPKKKRKRHRIELEVLPFKGRKHLPVVQLRRAA